MECSNCKCALIEGDMCKPCAEFLRPTTPTVETKSLAAKVVKRAKVVAKKVVKIAKKTTRKKK